MKIYKLRKSKNQQDTPMYSLSVPGHIGLMLEASHQERFTCELVEDGILYKPVSTTDFPEWMQPKAKPAS